MNLGNTVASSLITKDPISENAIRKGVCFKQRLENQEVDTFIVHACYVDPRIADLDFKIEGQETDPDFKPIREHIVSRLGEEALGTYNKDAIKVIFEFYGVSAHYVIDRQGQIFEFVPPELLAFHAGISKMPEPDNREAVNNFSIGVELLATEESGYTDQQYEALAKLTLLLKEQFPLKNFLGHSDVAPGRKVDPVGFDWDKYKKLINA